MPGVDTQTRDRARELAEAMAEASVSLADISGPCGPAWLTVNGFDAVDLVAAAAELQQSGRALHSAMGGRETWLEFSAAADAQAALPAPVDGLIGLGSLSFLAGAPKANKTWLAVCLALSLTQGRTFLGQFRIPRPLPVLYVALEGSRIALRDRVDVLARGMGIDPEDAAALDGLSFVYKPAGIELRDPRWGEWLAAHATEHGAQVVIVDVLRRAAAISEDNRGALDFAQLVESVRPLTDAGVALVLLHHHRKGSSRSDSAGGAESMAGSFALFGHADTYIGLRPSKDGTKVEFDGREFRYPDPLTINLVGTGSGTNGTLVRGDVASIEVVDVGGRQETTFRPTALMERASRFLEGRAYPCSKAAIENGVGGNRQYVRSALEILCEEGHVRSVPGGAHPKFESVSEYRQVLDPASDSFIPETSPNSPSLAQPSPEANPNNLAHLAPLVYEGRGARGEVPGEGTRPERDRQTSLLGAEGTP